MPGCYATGFITIAYPMVAEGILPKDYPVSAFAEHKSAQRRENVADHVQQHEEKRDHAQHCQVFVGKDVVNELTGQKRGEQSDSRCDNRNDQRNNENGKL